ncbi:hypothetical protein HLB42_20135 (plasmid) [Deinococcus sp. D7000]|nr:hypothetical protein HLB42_20135 [Deinococcus sp. D7000]
MPRHHPSTSAPRQLRPLYRDLPREALPPVSSSGLGETDTLGGVVKDWRASRAGPLFFYGSVPGGPPWRWAP